MSRKPFLSIILVICLAAIVPRSGVAELASPEEMRRICENWLAFASFPTNTRNEVDVLTIAEVIEIVSDDTLLAHCFTLDPVGYVVVPALKGITPIKAFSGECPWDCEQRRGLPQEVHGSLLRQFRAFASVFGSLDAVPRSAGPKGMNSMHYAAWDHFLVDPDTFANGLTRSSLSWLPRVGPLLTTRWRQNQPYRTCCPIGCYGQHCAPGCVGVATAQVMKYHNWPPLGEIVEPLELIWSGDNSCPGCSTEGDTLYADIRDWYSWTEMPDSLGVSSPMAQKEAIGELLYELALAMQGDFGVCGTPINGWAPGLVLPEYFRYHPDIMFRFCRNMTYEEITEALIEEINAGRPVIYQIGNHEIVVDGWWIGEFGYLFHTNWGWGNTNLGWYALEEFPGAPNVNDGFFVGVMPDASVGYAYVKPDGTGDYPTIQAAIDAMPSASLTFHRI
ncbi:MAG: C10 family peptidase, partial [Candidatus Eisenbacteria sp.]|nr:C10 family peptidase [Candidatus Eisenbacteria bacterium]